MSILQTRRLVLRPIAHADVPALHHFWTDPDVRRYLWDNEIISVAKVEELVASSEAFFEAAHSGFFTIEMIDNSGVLVGFCGHRQFEDDASVELLYGILPGYWGEGLVTEAATEVLRHGFHDCGFERVIAATDTPNQKSVNVMQRLGMVFECRREWHGLDTVFYAMAKTDFAAAR